MSVDPSVHSDILMSVCVVYVCLTFVTVVHLSIASTCIFVLLLAFFHVRLVRLGTLAYHCCNLCYRQDI